MRTALAFLVAAQVVLPTSLALAQSPATTLRVASVTPALDQPQQQDKAVIFYEDFDQLPDWRARFFEYVPEQESFIWTPDAGLSGGAMRCQFEKGQVSAGSLKVLFGQNPFGRGLRRDETFCEIYWRVYVKHEPGWEGNPAKLARATCLAGRDWSQGLIAHVWGGKGDALCIDPATGIRETQKVTTKYKSTGGVCSDAAAASPFFQASHAFSLSSCGQTSAGFPIPYQKRKNVCHPPHTA